MKTAYLLLLLPLVSFAQFQKPKLLARYGGTDGFNMPLGMVCFSSGPGVTADSVYLPCQDMQGFLMVRWQEGEFQEVVRARSGHHLSRPLVFSEGVAWYEYNEWGPSRSFVMNKALSVEPIKNSMGTDSFLPMGAGKWLYRLKEERPELWLWSGGHLSPFFQQDVSFIFPPAVSGFGEAVIKIRKNNWSESAPDELWLYSEGQWVKLLEDQDANPASRWISFRHQMSVDKGQILLVAEDKDGEVLVLVEKNKVTEIVRRSGDIAEFDYFAPILKNGTIVFRGVDKQKRKALWFHVNGLLGRLVTQGDIVITDKGPGRIHYKSEHSIFYGTPGIGPQGEIVQQATLTDPDHPDTLMGVGIIKFERE